MNEAQAKLPAGPGLMETFHALWGLAKDGAYNKDLWLRLQAWLGAVAADSENATHERGNAFAAAPCYAPLRWSAEKPAAAGWWWVKARGHAAQIREFEIELNPMCAEDHPIQPVGGPLSTEGWKWFAGPLPEPLEPLNVEPEHNIRISDTV